MTETDTLPLPGLELAPAPDPLAVRIARMVPQASRVQVLDLLELVAAEVELRARPPKRRNTLGPTP